jgi:Cof subfamily protein (haloacid dehalogenase superfamily)
LTKRDIRLILTDMDGTLLSPDLTVSAANRQAILDARAAGIETAIATGRLDLLVQDYVKQLDIRVPVVSCNGALVRDVAREDTVHMRAIPKAAAARLIRLCLEQGVDGLSYTRESVWYPRGSGRVGFFRDYNRMAEAGGTPPVDLRCYDEADPETVAASGVFKIFLARNRPGDIERLADQAGREIPGIDAINSVGDSLDIMAEGVSKGEALRILAVHLGLEPAQVAAFGDSENDISMLEAAGFAVAMGNAHPPVRAAADHVTSTNREDGFARAVYAHLLT